MKIQKVSVGYGELRSAGYPKFSNTRHEVELTAIVQDGETPKYVIERLQYLVKDIVKRAFGDPENPQTELDLPLTNQVEN
jgi:hypothetical protein